MQLPIANPSSVDMDPATLARAAEAIESLPEARALLVARHGQLVLERYMNGMTAGAQRNVKSVSKSVQSALTGIALREGFLTDLDTPAAEILPSYFPALPETDLGWGPWLSTTDELRRQITIRDLLTMRTSLAGSDLDDTYVALMAHAPDQVAFSSQLPMDGPPGRVFRYNTASAMLLNGVIAEATGMSPRDFANQHLFGPLGGSIERWRTDQRGLEIGGAELYLTARDMLRLGLLFIGGGELEGRRLIPADFVEESLSKQVGFEDPPTDPAAALLPDATGYGYMWWQRDSLGEDMVCAWGYGGQFICLVPSLDVTVVTQSTIDLNAEYHYQLFDIVDHLIVAPLR